MKNCHFNENSDLTNEQLGMCVCDLSFIDILC